MAWCRQATSHYLSQCWPRYMSPNGVTRPQWVNILRLRQNCCHLADGIFKCIFLNENVWILLKISPKFVRMVGINNIPALLQIMAWCQPSTKPLSGPMMVSLLTHICVTRPQWLELTNVDQHGKPRTANSDDPHPNPSCVKCNMLVKSVVSGAWRNIITYCPDPCYIITYPCYMYCWIHGNLWHRFYKVDMTFWALHWTHLFSDHCLCNSVMGPLCTLWMK